MVRWRETVLLFKANAVEEIVEIGAGRVLSGLIRRIDRDLATVSIGAPIELADFVKRL
jgi:[acyl-carrier-protein] S-malonyltransferase